MKSKNADRERTTVELGRDTRRKLNRLKGNESFKKHLLYWGRMSDSFLIRWAIAELYRSVFPMAADALVDANDVGAYKAGGRGSR